MTYQVLARKWRPQDFSSIVGQEPIVTALRNALKDGRIAQAYLFSGIRGVGKTTAARVLAKALNCENGPASDPCNECQICQDITSGHDMDVIEVDAATYSKVEQVRELTESLRYGPARNRHKVVVLDEVHRLSRQAFDALLKIVEEPPEHLVFVFATTEIDAVPATILSRCQEFQFRRVTSAALTEHLGRIAEAENIETSEAALRWIARAGEGSVRDSVALLDQLATFGGGKINEADAKRLLGGLDTEIFSSLLKSILGGEADSIRELTHEIEQNGWDPNHVYGQFLLFARDALHLALGGSPESIDLPGDEAKRLNEQVAGQDYENLLRLVQLLLSSEPTVRRSEFGHLALEITWLRAAQLPKLTRVEDLLSGKVKPTANLKSADSTIAADAQAPQPKIARSPIRRETQPKRAVQDLTQNTDSAKPARSNSSSNPGSIEAFVKRLENNRPLAPLFPIDRLQFDVAHGELLIHPPEGDTLIEAKLGRPNNIEFFEAILKEVFGPGTQWRIVRSKRASDPSRILPNASVEPVSLEPLPSDDVPTSTVPTNASPPNRQARTAKKKKTGPKNAEFKTAEQHPVVQKVLEIFNGTIQGTQLPTQEGDKT